MPITRVFRETTLGSAPSGWAEIGRQIPLVLTLMRLLLAPVIFIGAWAGWGPWAYTGILGAAVLSDIFDGVIARRLKIATANLRRLDSSVDTVFFLSAVGAIWLFNRDALVEQWLGVAAILVLKAIRSSFELVKFGRRSSYHMWSAKFWALTIAAGLISAAFDGSGLFFAFAICVGLATNLEGLAASLLLDRWIHDVPSLWHAIRLARENE